MSNDGVSWIYEDLPLQHNGVARGISVRGLDAK